MYATRLVVLLGCVATAASVGYVSGDPPEGFIHCEECRRCTEKTIVSRTERRCADKGVATVAQPCIPGSIESDLCYFPREVCVRWESKPRQTEVCSSYDVERNCQCHKWERDPLYVQPYQETAQYRSGGFGGFGQGPMSTIMFRR